MADNDSYNGCAEVLGMFGNLYFSNLIYYNWPDHLLLSSSAITAILAKRMESLDWKSTKIRELKGSGEGREVKIILWDFRSDIIEHFTVMSVISILCPIPTVFYREKNDLLALGNIQILTSTSNSFARDYRPSDLNQYWVESIAAFMDWRCVYLPNVCTETAESHFRALQNNRILCAAKWFLRPGLRPKNCRRGNTLRITEKFLAVV